MKKLENDAQLNQILYMKRLNLTIEQASKLSGVKKSEVERIYSAKMLRKRATRAKFNIDNYKPISI